MNCLVIQSETLVSILGRISAMLRGGARGIMGLILVAEFAVVLALRMETRHLC